MPNAFFSPTNKVTGGALFGTWNSKEGNVYLKLLRQVANNADKKGNFDGKNPINLKLSQDEAADFIRVVRTKAKASFYHKFNDDVTSGSFSYYELDSTDKEGKPTKRAGYGLSVKKGEQEIKVGFTLGSAERFSLFLQNALTHIMDAEYAADKKEYLERQKNKKDAPAQEEPPKTEDSTQLVDQDSW